MLCAFRGVECAALSVSPITMRECTEGSISCHKWEEDNPHLFALALSSGPQLPSNSPASLWRSLDQLGVAVACRPDIKETLEALKPSARTPGCPLYVSSKHVSWGGSGESNRDWFQMSIGRITKKDGINLSRCAEEESF